MFGKDVCVLYGSKETKRWIKEETPGRDNIKFLAFCMVHNRHSEIFVE